jgi:ATP synthase protein I
LKEETKQFLKELLKGGGQASAIGMSLVFAILIGGVVGYLLSEYTGSRWWFYLGLILGIIAGFRNLVIMSRKYRK